MKIRASAKYKGREYIQTLDVGLGASDFSLGRSIDIDMIRLSSARDEFEVWDISGGIYRIPVRMQSMDFVYMVSIPEDARIILEWVQETGLYGGEVKRKTVKYVIEKQEKSNVS